MTTNSFSLNALKRWSCSDGELPTVDQIKNIHVYDFDNTLFASPLPNRQLWQGPTIGLLQTQEAFVSGGWWHDPNILKCTGEGVEVEEPRAWHGWWNESIVDLVKLSMQQKDAVSVLLTGRTEKGFAEIVQRMIRSKKLAFDMIVLRPQVGPANQKFASTMKFKQAFLEALACTYSQAAEIRIYEDRPKHVQGFREFFADLNRTYQPTNTSAPRTPIQTEVIEVAEKSTTLDPIIECAEVQKAINTHNLAFRDGTLPGMPKSWEIKKNVFFTGYLLSPKDTEALLQTAKLPTDKTKSTPATLATSAEITATDGVRTLANSILITPRPCPPHILDKVGGMGKKLRWRVVALGNLDNKVFAAKVEPVPSTEKFYIENKVPMVVLAVRDSGKPIDANRIHQWKSVPDDKAIEFDTVVGEKVLLRVEQERPMDEGLGLGSKRSWQQQHDEDFPPLAPSQPSAHSQLPSGPKGQAGPHSQRRGYHSGENRRPNGNLGQDGSRGGQRFNAGRGGAGPAGGGQRNNFSRPRGGGPPPDGRGRGRGGYPGYRSLDDDARRKGNSFGGDGANDEGLSY